MRKVNILLVLVLLFINFSTGYAQEEKENAFYLSGRKVTEITCYDFDNLSFRFKIEPEMFAYDQVIFQFRLTNSETKSGGAGAFFKAEDMEYIWEYTMNKALFSAKYEGKTDGEVVIIEKGSDVNSKFKRHLASPTTNDIRMCGRPVLQYTSFKVFVEGAKIGMAIRSATSKGMTTYVDNGVVKSREEFDYGDIKTFDQNGIVLLKNRVRVGTGMSNEFPKEVVKTGNCK